MNRVLLALIIVLLAGVSNSPGQVPEFNDPREGITAAKQDGRLVIFILSKSFSEDAKSLEEVLDKQLMGVNHNFVIVNCRESTAAHKTMFEQHFKQDISVLPVAVVTDTEGKILSRAVGVDEKEYDKLITVARINAGIEKDPNKIKEAVERFEGEDGDEMVGDSIFGMRKRDLEGSVMLSPKRTWTYVDGRTFEGSLLEARNQIGVFIVEENTRKEVNFNDLSDEDKSYLGALLNSQ